MPFINVKTNQSVSKEKELAVKSAMGQAITAVPGKSENWLMVEIEPEKALYFKGSDAPAAMVEVSIFGSPNPSALSDLTSRITSTLSGELSIPSDRIYVSYQHTKDWGWNGSNF